MTHLPPLRFISDPKNPTNIFKNGISGEMTVTGLEVQTIESLGTFGIQVNFNLLNHNYDN